MDILENRETYIKNIIEWEVSWRYATLYTFIYQLKPQK